VKRFTRDELSNKRVGVLSGGLSVERDVSLRSGAAISEALRSLGYRVVDVDVQRDVALRLLDMSIDVAFIALHGRYGEDGSIQGLLESMHLPYTGSGVLASAVGMEKVLSKQIFLARGIPTPDYRSFDTPGAALAGLDELPFPLPLVVKPSREGSSVGVFICRTREACTEAIPKAAGFTGSILVEQFVAGREIQGAVLDDTSLGAIEVVPAREFYDYEAKYSADSGTKYLFPAPLPGPHYARVNAVCLAAHKSLGCSGATRSDCIVSAEGDVWLLELNTLPGMTALSLLPKIAAGRGIDFPALCERLLLGASLKS
jgi:D-alanine-D-alanine ligase